MQGLTQSVIAAPNEDCPKASNGLQASEGGPR